MRKLKEMFLLFAFVTSVFFLWSYDIVCIGVASLPALCNPINWVMAEITSLVGITIMYFASRDAIDENKKNKKNWRGKRNGQTKIKKT